MSLDNALNNEVQDPTEEDPASLPQRSELEVLQERATQLGLKFRSNTGVDKLRAMVNAAIEGNTVEDEEEEVSESAIPQPTALPLPPKKPKPRTNASAVCVTKHASWFAAASPATTRTRPSGKARSSPSVTTSWALCVAAFRSKPTGTSKQPCST